ncbi:MAG: Ku protein, partial [Allosphingosinicella sp.]
PSKYHDRYIEAVEALIERKRKGKTIQTDEEEAPARGSNVIDLMAALKRSIEKPGAAGGKATGGGSKKAPAKAAPARKRA